VKVIPLPVGFVMFAIKRPPEGTVICEPENAVKTSDSEVLIVPVLPLAAVATTPLDEFTAKRLTLMLPEDVALAQRASSHEPEYTVVALVKIGEQR
jgi:hypothetical protein